MRARTVLSLACTAAAVALCLPASAAETALAPCAPVTGAVVVKIGSPFSGSVTTPRPMLTQTVAAGTYVIDLSGQPVGTGQLVADLSWDTPLGLGDYDLYINGQGDAASGDSPETTVVEVGHCDLLTMTTEGFTGTPVDKLTLALAVTADEAPDAS